MRPSRVCRECGKKRTKRFMASPTLCKKCAAKGRVPTYNPEYEILPGIRITRRIEKRLRREASSLLPESRLDRLAEGIAIICIPLTGISLYIALFQWNKDSVILLITIPVIGFIVYHILLWPGKRLLNKKTLELAEDRKNKLDEYERFYTSSEWQRLRKNVIAENDGRCCMCGKKIRKDFDTTVDHIKPRSLYPELSLVKENLRVLCRSCNSSKGSSEDFK